MSNVYSFDVFDTCLTRTCGNASNVFELLATRILGDDANEIELSDFALIRKRGEYAALSYLNSNEKEEITLKEIYDHCDFSSILTVDNNYVMQKELQLEREVLKPVAIIKDKITRLRKDGNKIIFISDMYLPEQFIDDILTEYGIKTSVDSLYVSSEYGIRKSSGKLYRLIKEKEKIDISSWHHEGDNEISDVKVPRHLHIKATMVCHDYSNYEKLRQKQVPFNSIHYQAYSAGISRSIRLERDDDNYWNFAIDLIAPLYVSFVSWLMADAHAKGFNKLFFMARDGKIFYKIAEKFKSSYPNIEIKYIYVSRKSLYLPGLDNITTESIQKMVLGDRLENVLDCFQMEDFSPNLTKYGDMRGRILIEALLNDTQFVEELKRRINTSKELLLKYLRQEGIDGKSAIVDLNGTRTCHKIISRIMNMNNNSSELSQVNIHSSSD